MRKFWEIFFGVLGIILALLFIFTPFALTAELNLLSIYSLLAILAVVFSVFSFKGKIWSNVAILILFVLFDSFLYLKLFQHGVVVYK